MKKKNYVTIRLQNLQDLSLPAPLRYHMNFYRNLRTVNLIDINKCLIERSAFEIIYEKHVLIQQIKRKYLIDLP